jgi:hypothetical protein
MSGPFRDDPTALQISNLKSEIDHLKECSINAQKRIEKIEKRMLTAPIADFFRWLVYIPKRTIEWLFTFEIGMPLTAVIVVCCIVFGGRECSESNSIQMLSQCRSACEGMNAMYVSHRSNGPPSDDDADFCTCSGRDGITVYNMSTGRPVSPNSGE